MGREVYYPASYGLGERNYNNESHEEKYSLIFKHSVNAMFVFSALRKLLVCLLFTWNINTCRMCSHS
jgi:hypothetical protein